jgi:hypothetical protein
MKSSASGCSKGIHEDALAQVQRLRLDLVSESL